MHSNFAYHLVFSILSFNPSTLSTTVPYHWLKSFHAPVISVSVI